MFELPIALDIAARSLLLTTAALLWVVALVRMLGLRAFSQMTAFDFVATVAIGSLLAAAATASSWSAFFQTGLAIGALLAVQALLAVLRGKSKRLRSIIGNTPIILMENGDFCEAALQLTRVARVNGSFTHPIGNANVVLLQDPATLRIAAAAAR